MITKRGKIYLKFNAFCEDVPIAIAFKSMGIESDQEIIQMVGGSEERVLAAMAPCLEECHKAQVFTETQVSLCSMKYYNFMYFTIKTYFIP